MRLRTRFAAALACSLLGLPVAMPATAVDEPAADPAATAESEADEADESGASDLEAYWRRRLDKGATRLELARERAEQAEAEYARARHDGSPRGEALGEIKHKHLAAERELREAKAALPRLLEQARRAGVSPGVLRDYEEEDEDAE